MKRGQQNEIDVTLFCIFPPVIFLLEQQMPVEFLKNPSRITHEFQKPSGFSGGNLDFCFPAAKVSLLFSQCTPLALHRNLTRK